MIETKICKEEMVNGNIPIYFITCLEKDGTKVTKYKTPDFGEQRTMGFFEKYEDAVQALHENWGDIREYFYDYAIVERMFQGVYPTCFKLDSSWFQWDKEKKGFFEADFPKWVMDICNFAMG